MVLGALQAADTAGCTSAGLITDADSLVFPMVYYGCGRPFIDSVAFYIDLVRSIIVKKIIRF